MKTIKISKEELCKLYQEKECSLEEIGKKFNCSRQAIFYKFKKFGIKTRNNTGKDHWNWKGGIMHSFGYVFIKKPDHPRAIKRGYVHRSYLVAEKTLGRYLYPHEITHHKNEIKDDDRPENIEVTTNSKHTSFHRKNRKKRSIP